MIGSDLLGPQPTKLNPDPEPAELLESGTDPKEVAAQYPDSSLTWAYLAEAELGKGNPIPAYAYARTGYHRGIDQLRRSGWKGWGLVPYQHEGNQGWLRCVAALSKAANLIGETDEYIRCLELINDSDPSQETAKALGIK